MKKWTQYSSRRLPLHFSYPDPTPEGVAVNIEEKEGASSFRVHLTSPESGEIYFEAGHYIGVSLSKAIDDFISHLVGMPTVARGDDTETTYVAGSPARRLTLHWPEKSRIVLFIDREEAIYRFIFDPESAVNSQILATVTFE